MNTIRTKLLLLSLLITRILFSQQYLKPEVLSADKGLLNPAITALITDYRGFLWAGTENGLYRYDGYHFKWIGQTPGKAGIIGSKTIIEIEQDKDHNLWFITDKGLEFYDHKTGIITVYSHQLIHKENIPAEAFLDLYVAPEQTIWTITESRLLKMISGNVVSSFPLPQEENNPPTCIAGDKNGNLWIGTHNGLLVFDMNSEKFTELFSAEKDFSSLLTNSHVTCIYIDSRTDLWIGTRNGLNRFDPVDVSFGKYYPVSFPRAHPGNDIRSIREDTKSSLVIITGDGLFSYNHHNGNFHRPEIQLPDPSYRSQLTSVLIDRQGIFWIGTHRGIIKVRKAPLKIENITPDNKASLKLPESNITAVAEDARGMIWLGYQHSGVSIADRNLMRMVSYSANGYSNLSGNAVRSFYTDRKSRFYVISAHAIDKFNFSNSRFETILANFPLSDKKIFDNLEIQAMTEDSLNNFWIGTSNGLVYIDFVNRVFKKINRLQSEYDSLILSVIYDLKTDNYNNLWLGTNNGLVQYNIAQKQFSRFTPYDKELLNTGHKNIYVIEKGVKDIYWIGTSEGCYQFDIRQKTFSSVSSNPDLLSSEIVSITVDPYENLWIATRHDIFYYCTSTQSLRHFDYLDGLNNFGFNINASSGKNGRNVYFGGSNGLTIIQNDSLYVTDISPPTTISGITLLHKGKVFREFIEIPDTISIPRGNYAIHIKFTMPDFNRPEQNQYRYSIAQQGKPSEMIDLYTSNSVILGGLSQGNYYFNVTGSTGNGEWNSKPAFLIITVEVPFWQSKPAYTVYFILILAFIIFLFRYWARQLIKANQQYKEREKIARQIMLQKEELTLKNKSITDSINYARRIQNAMLPPIKMFKSYFPQSFLFYMPKDIVSGDFYWINKLYSKIFISAVDCTGHGVPGAFMSIIGFELFRKITNIEGLSRPSDILNKLNEDFHEIFKDVDNVVLRDGMDVAFCAIDINDMILEFSGAFNPLYLIRDNKITEIKGDRFAIGIDETNFKDQTFKNHMIPLQEGDIIYIFSDGFADQFGGPEGKKFKYRRFRHLLLNIHQLPMDDQRNILETSLREWKGDLEQVDDVMVLGIKIDL
ncbi:MAG: SpoIIE family protein phosphatase [Bacteroidales bacterium]|nr:SpoIIE family protein phosphatase [Bacteroidales bacterium]MBN2763132.1 SpoIIE family protein phosphatase [Bacteroidales bacterium]